MSLHVLSKIKITKYFNCGPRFNGGFSTDNLSKIKDGIYVINLDDKKSKGSYWIPFFIDKNAAVYFDSSGIEYILQEILNKIKYKSITNNIIIIQSDDSIICGFFLLMFH